ncbi:MAG: hypothetical protein QOJ23_4191 [Actinomycetota bacterium]|nr:hypothetical protein [Actinomycetota bacterium]
MIAVVIVAAAVAGAVLAVSGGSNGQEATAPDGPPPAPWQAKAVHRSAVPPAYVTAWDRARNRTSCALLFPLDGGPALNGARATGERTPDDNGWDIFLTNGAGSIEVLGLFDGATRPDTTSDAPRYTRTWADGSVARYTVDVGNAAPGTFDPNSSPFEAVLTIPGQGCGYRIYDTLGKDHLEAVFDRLRFMGR